MSETVYVRATREEVGAILNGSPAAAGASRQLLTRIGLTALGRVKAAFVVKSRGGTDEAGERWAPLSPKTVAYGRRHPGLPPKKSRERPSGILSAKQRKRWWEVYSRSLARLKGDKGRAAAVAWHVLKGEGAPTILGRYGGAKVDILRDTGLLLNSLSPGVPGSVEDQVFRTAAGEVVVGTNRKGAAAHHRGVPGRLPQRRLWPAPAKWPASWWQDLLEQTREGLVEVIREQLQRS